MDRIGRHFSDESSPSRDELSYAFWFASHGGERPAAEHLLHRGAELNWIPHWEKLTPLDAAQRQGAGEVAAWLQTQGAKSASEMA
jgi:hypothetical protein